MSDYGDEDSRTIFCANISEKVTEALLFELFLQGGPLEKISQPKDKDGRNRSFAFVTYVHAVSVPYAVNLFQGTQLFNRELTIKPRNNNTNSNVQQKVENPMPVQPHPSAIRNPFDGNSRNGNGNGVDNERTRVERVVDQPNPLRMQYDQSSLRSGFQPIPTKASMQMQPQPSKRFDNQKQTNPTSMDDLNKLLSLGSNMLQPSSSQRDTSKRQPYDMQFADRAASEKQSSNLKMTNRHKSRSHYRDEPYSRRDPQHHHHHRSNNDRRRR